MLNTGGQLPGPAHCNLRIVANDIHAQCQCYIRHFDANRTEADNADLNGLVKGAPSFLQCLDMFTRIAKIPCGHQ